MPKACLYSDKHHNNEMKDFDRREALTNKTVTLFSRKKKAKKPEPSLADYVRDYDEHCARLGAAYAYHKPALLVDMAKFCPVKMGDKCTSTGCRPGLPFKVDTITVEPHNGLQFVMVGQIIKKCGTPGKQRGRCQIAVEDLL